VSREHKQFVNDSALGKLSDKTDDIWSASVNADWQDGWGSGGINAAQLITSFGNLNLDGLASDRALDDATAATNGDWNKVAYSYTRLQHLKGAVSLFVLVSGQFASKNLDSAEKIYLGGPQSVRAYPQGEAPGDEGQVINLELRYDQNDALQFLGFVDYGRVRLHREEWANWQGTNPIAQNNYDLMGMGVGLNWSMPGQFQVKVALARRIGTNPGRDPVTGNDSDGAQARARGWIQAVRYF
jgi:hemolysin activation/secretion protein